MNTPWGKAQHIKNIERGVRFVSTAGHGGIMVSKGLAEKKMPASVLRNGIPYGGYYGFEEDIDWRLVVLCLPNICPALGIESYDDFVKESAQDAVFYKHFRPAYLEVCKNARAYMTEYVKTEGVEAVRKRILQYADRFDRTGKRDWAKDVHNAIYSVAEMFRSRGVGSESDREEIFAVGCALIKDGSIRQVNDGQYDVFLPVCMFKEAS